MDNEYREYINKILVFVNKMEIGKNYEIEPLTNDRDKFIKAIKYIINYHREDLEFLSGSKVKNTEDDWKYIRLSKAYHIDFSGKDSDEVIMKRGIKASGKLDYSELSNIVEDMNIIEIQPVKKKPIDTSLLIDFNF